MSSSELSLRGRLAVALLERTPPRSALAATQMMGVAARVPLPARVSRLAVGAYARFFDVDLGEVDPSHLERGYASFDAFFTRNLREGARVIDKDPNVLVSPCDGRLREFAEIEAQGVVVAKGHAYAIGELLGDAQLAARFVGGLQAVIYLHPRDYHRVHTPVTGRATRLSAIPGRLLPVNDASVSSEPRLFALNERQVHLIESDYGAVAVVLVAAFGVGHMSCSYTRLAVHPDREVVVEPKPAPLLTKGEELGVFHLGSTVVLLTEAGFEPARAFEPGARLELGEALLRRRDA